MSYYKITYESNTVEGIKALQGSFPGHGANASGSNTFETSTPPPRQQNEENSDAFPGPVQAPPAAGDTGGNLDFSHGDAFYPPPPNAADSATTDIGLEGEIQPPPKSKL